VLLLHVRWLERTASRMRLVTLYRCCFDNMLLLLLLLLQVRWLAKLSDPWVPDQLRSQQPLRIA
jgi:hypothetical protein